MRSRTLRPLYLKRPYTQYNKVQKDIYILQYRRLRRLKQPWLFLSQRRMARWKKVISAGQPISAAILQKSGYDLFGWNVLAIWEQTMSIFQLPRKVCRVFGRRFAFAHRGQPSIAERSSPTTGGKPRGEAATRASAVTVDTVDGPASPGLDIDWPAALVAPDAFAWPPPALRRCFASFPR